MERLTEKCYCGYDITNRKTYKDYTDKEIFSIIQKLGKLEDIMEKYNIDSIEELEDMCIENKQRKS